MTLRDYLQARCVHHGIPLPRSRGIIESFLDAETARNENARANFQQSKDDFPEVLVEVFWQRILEIIER
jgi:hypothetical protein